MLADGRRRRDLHLRRPAALAATRNHQAVGSQFLPGRRLARCPGRPARSGRSRRSSRPARAGRGSRSARPGNAARTCVGSALPVLPSRRPCGSPVRVHMRRRDVLEDELVRDVPGAGAAADDGEGPCELGTPCMRRRCARRRRSSRRARRGLTARNARRRVMSAYVTVPRSSSQVLVKERRVAEAAVRVAGVVGHGAEARPAEALVEPVGGPLARPCRGRGASCRRRAPPPRAAPSARAPLPCRARAGGRGASPPRLGAASSAATRGRTGRCRRGRRRRTRRAARAFRARSPGEATRRSRGRRRREAVHEADGVAAVDGVVEHARQVVDRLARLGRVESPHLNGHGTMLRPETTRPPLGETLHEEAACEQRDPDGEEARRPGE